MAAGPVLATLRGHSRPMNLFRMILAASTALATAGAVRLPAAETPPLVEAVQRRDAAAWRPLLVPGAELQTADADGNTALHWAALHHDRAAVAALLAAGAVVDAKNAAGATPLHYGAGDAAVVRALLARGANPNAVTAAKTTPLMVALVQPDGFEAAELLLAAGADVRATRSEGRESMVARAISSGNRRSIDLVLASGVELKAGQGSSALSIAAFYGDEVTARQLLARGAELDRTNGFNGHPLNQALYAGHAGVAKLLVEAGSDRLQRSPRGPRTPPLIWAAYPQDGDPTVARLLLERGVDPDMPDADGATALAYALRNGPDTPLVALLREAGAKEPAAGRRRTVPDRPVPDSAAGVAALVRERLPATLDLLQRSSLAFLDNPFVQKANCISCHGQDLTSVVTELARARSFAVDAGETGRRLRAHRAMWEPETAKAREMIAPLPDMPVSAGYGFFGAKAVGAGRDATSDAYVRFLLRTQRPDGSWPSQDRRPPMEDGPINSTAWAALAVRDYAPAGYEAEAAASQAKSAAWLARQEPKTHNDAVFRLLGRHWSGESAARVAGDTERLVRSQRPDGGWAQLPGLASDAWATGTALYALHIAGGVAPDAPVYRRGVAFLLRTQFEDGSWWVRSRAWPFQPHFDGKFPHGKDQWISQGATGWAAAALLFVLPETRDFVRPAYAALAAAGPERKPGAPAAAAPAAARRVAGPEAPAVDFTRDLLPLLERSCRGCHGSEKPRAEFSALTREALLKGGASGEKAVVPGDPEASPLVRYIEGKIEDLEMPPLDRREKYPAFTAAETALLRAWIAAGAP